MREDKPLTLAEDFFDCRDGAWRACPHKRRLDSEPFSARFLVCFFDFSCSFLKENKRICWFNEVQRILNTYFSPLLTTQNYLLRSSLELRGR
jgi:hypothetical protein